MTKVKFGSTFGNFKWTGELDLTDEQLVAMSSLGGLQIYQRSPSTSAEKSLAGYEKRPDNFERKSIEFSDANATKLAKLLQAPIDVESVGKLTLQNVNVVFHEIGASSAPKFVEEKGIIARHVKAGDVAEWASNTLGYSGETVDHDGNASQEFLAAVKAYKTKMLASV